MSTTFMKEAALCEAYAHFQHHSHIGPKIACWATLLDKLQQEQEITKDEKQQLLAKLGEVGRETIAAIQAAAPPLGSWIPTTGLEALHARRAEFAR